MTKDWGRWTGAERDRSYRLTLRAIQYGLIPHQSQLACSLCGQREGIRDYHSVNYDHPTKFLEPLCYRCHMILHNEHNDPDACERYWDEIAHGKQYPPLHTRNFGLIMREHGFRRKRKD